MSARVSKVDISASASAAMWQAAHALRDPYFQLFLRRQMRLNHTRVERSNRLRLLPSEFAASCVGIPAAVLVTNVVSFQGRRRRRRRREDFIEDLKKQRRNHVRHHTPQSAAVHAKGRGRTRGRGVESRLTASLSRVKCAEKRNTDTRVCTQTLISDLFFCRKNTYRAFNW